MLTVMAAPHHILQSAVLTVMPDNPHCTAPAALMLCRISLTPLEPAVMTVMPDYSHPTSIGCSDRYTG